MALSANGQDDIAGIRRSLQRVEKQSYHAADTNYIKLLNQLALAYHKVKVDSMRLLAERTIMLSEKHGYYAGLASGLGLRGLYHTEKKDFDIAIIQYKEALEIAKKHGLTQQEGEVNKKIGDQYFQQRQLSKAIHYYNKATEQFTIVGDGSSLAACWHSLGNLYYHQANYSYALSQYFKALEIREELHELPNTAATLNNIANIYNSTGNYAEALVYYNKSLKIKREIPDKHGVAASINNIASIYYYQGDYSEALGQYYEALKIYEELNDKSGKSFAFNNIALIYDQQEKYFEALEYNFKSLQLKKELGNTVAVASSLNNIAVIFEKQGKLELAMDYHFQSLQASESTEELEGVSASLNNIATIYKKQKDYTSALEYYYKSLEIDEESGNKRGIVASKTNLGFVYLELKEFPKALHHAQEALKLAEVLGVKDKIRDCNQILSQVFEALGRHHDALFHHKFYKQYADSLQNLEIEKKSAYLQAQYEYDIQLSQYKAEQKTIDLQNERKVQVHKLQRNMLILICVIILIFAYYIYKSLNKQKLSKRLLEEKTRELEKADQIKSKLFSIIGHDLKNPIGSLYSVLDLNQKGLLNQHELETLLPKLHKNVGSIVLTLDNLLKWSMAEMAMMKPDPKSIALSDAIIELREFFSSMIQAKSIEIKIDIADHQYVYADPNHLQVILRNLINNAIKFSNERGIVTIEVKEAGEMLQISVQDNGIGMSPDDSKALFSNSIAESKRGTKGEKGTGLGLSLCKYYVEQNGGKIWVESISGQGSTFFISLPKAIQKLQNSLALEPFNIHS